jgi:hypothetical protein
LGFLRAGDTEAVRRGRHRHAAALTARFLLGAIQTNPQSMIFRPAAMVEQLALSRQGVSAEMAKGGWHGSIDFSFSPKYLSFDIRTQPSSRPKP